MAPAVIAQDTFSSIEQATDPYERLFEALTPQAGLDQALDNMMSEMRSAYEKQPDMMQIEVACPGSIDVMVKTIVPFMGEYNAIEMNLRREATLRILREELSDEHARAAHEFYSSELGQKLVMAALNNFTAEETFEEALADPDSETVIDEQSFRRDQINAAFAAARTLSPQEMKTVNGELAGTDWFAALKAAQVKISAANLKIANSDFAPEVDKRVDLALDEAIEGHFETCDY